ncbi:MBL fold metallo-hydrolase [Vibrio olivae]
MRVLRHHFFYVGDQGVLLFDPLEQRAEPILESIRSVTDKPITAIVYSHDHADHLAATGPLLEMLKTTQSQAPEIIASQATAEKCSCWTAIFRAQPKSFRGLMASSNLKT